MADRVGQQLGNYRLTQLLGRGGFAEVYLGEHLRLRTRAAIKVLQTQLAGDEVASFQKEAQTIANLAHPHIVRVLDFDVAADGSPFLVMEHAPNGTLRQRHPRGTRLAPEVILPYVRQIADALQYAHEEKLVHRDIKPENLLLGQRKQVLLSDFGVALVVQSSQYQGTPEVAGTLAYMAPEQIQGHPRPASDQYALGIVIYEWLSGERPFAGSMSEVVARHLSMQPPPLREKLPALSPMLEQVIMTMLAKDPRERFGSVRAFATAFESACQTDTSFLSAPTQHVTPTVPLTPPAPPSTTLADQPTLMRSPSDSPIITPAGTLPPTTEPPTPGTVQAQPMPIITTPAEPQTVPDIPIVPAEPAPPRRRLSRRAVLIAGSSAAGLAALGSGGFWLVRSLGALTPPTPTPTPTLPTPTTPASLGTLFYTYQGHSFAVYAVTWSPDGTRIASGSVDRTVQVWDAADGGNAFTYHGHSSYVAGVAWSPDGARIASGSGDRTVRIWDASDGGRPFTYRGHGEPVTAVAWSHTGTRIASADYDNTAQVWDPNDGSHVFTYYGHSNYVAAVAWSPGDKRIASGSNDRTVQVWNAADGSNAFTYHGHTDLVRAVVWSPDGKRIASGGNDRTVQVWDAADGGNAFTYHGHSATVVVVAWSPDGKRIASGGFDNTVQVWQGV